MYCAHAGSCQNRLIYSVNIALKTFKHLHTSVEVKAVECRDAYFQEGLPPFLEVYILVLNTEREAEGKEEK